MNKLNKFLILSLKGVGMGAANVVPGVSGGTIALMTGIYTELIEAINSLMDPNAWKTLFKGNFKEFWQAVHGNFMAALMVGVIVSIFSLAKIATFLMVAHPVQLWAFFFGLIIASSIIMLKDVKGWRFIDIVYTILGIILGVVICTMTPTNTPDAMWFIALCGALAMCTMILPGISGSFVLLILGKYDFIMNALGDFDGKILAVFGIGAVLGILAFSKFLHWLLKNYERGTMLILIGFVIGSLVKVWPWFDKAPLIKADGLNPNNLPLESLNIPMEALHIPGAIISAIGGIVFVFTIEYLGKKLSSKS